MNKNLKTTLIFTGTVMGLYLLYEGYNKLKEEHEELKAKRALKKLEDERLYNLFIAEKDDFLKEFDDSKLSSISLGNDKIKSVEDKAYVYAKIKAAINKVKNCSYSDKNEFDDYKSDFLELFLLFNNANEDVIEAKIVSMKKEDEARAKIIAENRERQAEERKYQRELDIIKENHRHEQNTYETKLNIEKAKLDTICKAVSGATNKNISSTLNIKTNVNED